jgi:magnesium transporter
MIKYYYKNLRTKKVGELETYHPGAWVYVESPTADEVDFLVKHFKLNEGHIADALDPDEMPRLERENDLSYIYMRYAYTAKDLELTTAPLMFIVGKDLFITIARGRLPQIDRFLNGEIAFATTQRTKLLLQIMNQISDQYETYINTIARQISIVRTRLKVHEIKNQDFVDFVLIEEELNDFLSAMLPTTALLRRLTLGKYIPLFEEDTEIVEDLLLNNEQSIEGCRAHIKTVANIRQAYSTISSNNLNQTMRILTAATVLITLPNIIYGMYGMNISLPFQDEEWAYFFVLGLSLGISAFIYFVGKRKRVF